MSRSMLVAVLAAAVTMLGVLSPAQPADLLVSSRNSEPTDFDAEPRPEDLAIGYDERP